MKIAIIGAGAMGSLFGGYLTLSGEEVWLVDIRREQIETVRSLGLTIEEGGKLQVINVNATLDVKSIGKADIVLFFVKTYHMEKAVSDALALEKKETLYLTLQNGLGVEEMISKKIDRKKIILGVTNHGATLVGPGHIRHAGKGSTFIGELDHQITDRAKEIAEKFCDAGFQTEVSPNIHHHVWEKFLINVGINALTALTGFKNGQLLDYPETLRLMEQLVFEAVEVAKKNGIPISPGNAFEKVKRVAEATRKNRSSMGQDFDFRQKTEIDVINGAVVKEAQRLGIAVPCNQMITDLVKAIEKSF